jgi:hypothetical protein
MRLAFIIVCLCATAVALVRIRTDENVLRNRMLTLQQYYEIDVPRQLWEQQVELSYLTSPIQVQNRAQELALQLVDKDKKTGLAKAPGPNENRRGR